MTTTRIYNHAKDVAIKRCCTCKESKSLCEFGFTNGAPRYRCRKCERECMREIRERHRGAISASQRDYYHRNQQQEREKARHRYYTDPKYMFTLR
jgi:hypothetical protein